MYIISRIVCSVMTRPVLQPTEDHGFCETVLAYKIWVAESLLFLMQKIERAQFNFYIPSRV